jgi:deazaflavin-dependent oxidoreductase (nitroreductase family)
VREQLSTRLEHELDSRSVGLAAWLYRRTRGRIARLYRRDVLLLTTTGRRSGLQRTVPLQFFADGDDMVVVAANSGMATHPAWYLNLCDDPEALVEVGGNSVRVRAEEMSETDADAFRAVVLSRAPDYSRYLERTDRRIPMIRLTPIGSPRPAGTRPPGFDCAGVVHSTGEDVTEFSAGDAVFGNALGSLAEFALAKQDQLAAIPEGWSFEQAATVPESGCVALQAVRNRGDLREGQRVAVLGAGGGVGSHALQIAVATGAPVTAVFGTRMLDAVRELGATEVVDYRHRDLADTGHRYDLIIDTAGRTPLHTLRRALTRHGRLVLVGADHSRRVTGGLGRWVRALIWSPFVPQQLRPFVARPLDRSCLDELVELMATKQLTPCVDRTFPLSEAAEAMHHLDHRGSPGKVVVRP